MKETIVNEKVAAFLGIFVAGGGFIWLVSQDFHLPTFLSRAGLLCAFMACAWLFGRSCELCLAALFSRNRWLKIGFSIVVTLLLCGLIFKLGSHSLSGVAGLAALVNVSLFVFRLVIGPSTRVPEENPLLRRWGRE